MIAIGVSTLATLIAVAGALRRRFHQPTHTPYGGNASLMELRELPETSMFYPDSSTLDRLGNEMQSVDLANRRIIKGEGQ